MPVLIGPVRLGTDHVLRGFASGEPSVDEWLVEHALAAAGARSARTYVVCDPTQAGRVVGFHALTVTGLAPERAPARARRGTPRSPLPVVLLARLAVDRSVQGRGLGAALLADAMVRTISAAEHLGIRALLVHALHERAAGFYRSYGFVASPTDPLHLVALVKDMRATLDATSSR